MVKKEKLSSNPGLRSLPELVSVPSGETFGLVQSRHTESFGGLLQIKDEADDDEYLLNLPIDIVEKEAERLMEELHIDPALRFIPQSATIALSDANASPVVDNSRLTRSNSESISTLSPSPGVQVTDLVEASNIQVGDEDPTMVSTQPP